MLGPPRGRATAQPLLNHVDALPYVVSPNCTRGWSRPVTGSPSEITEITAITGSQVEETSVGAETQQVNNWG